MEDHFKKFGPIKSIVLNKGFGFIQYHHEDSARRALQGQPPTIQGRTLFVKPAYSNASGPPNNNNNHSGNSKEPIPANNMNTSLTMSFKNLNEMPKTPVWNSGPNTQSMNNNNNNSPRGMQNNAPMHQQPLTSSTGNYDDANDCEIIVGSRELTSYAEMIEMRLKGLGLSVDLLFPNSDVPIGKVLGNISSRGCLYAVVVAPQNQEHRSITVNILYGQPAEHRNMPLDDALTFIHKNFEARRKALNSNGLATNHPEAIQIILAALVESRALTCIQYDVLIKYLQEQREALMKLEMVVEEPKVPEKTEEERLQEKILSILNKPQISENMKILETTEPEPMVDDKDILSDPRVQKALDNLLNSCISFKI